MSIKKCTKCKIFLDDKQFYKNKSKKDGLMSCCKKCKSNSEKLFRLTHKEEIKKRHKQYYLKNIEKEKLRNKKYYLKNIEKARIVRRTYYINNKDKAVQYGKEYRLKNKEKMKEWQKKYHIVYKDKLRKYYQNYYYLNKDEIYKKSKISNYKRKIDCFNAYGGCICKCCGEKEIGFLSLDHVENDGADERRKLKKQNIYQYLKNNKYPDKHRYQVLCMNCQYGKKLNNGVCFHKTTFI